MHNLKSKITEQSEENTAPTTLAAEDFYLDGSLFVFTAAYHRKRGFCCNNQCRHCPYDEDGNPVPNKGDRPAC